jgi:hypothetical protein
MLIKNTVDEKAKEFMINYCIAMLFKYNKYEAAILIMFDYEYNIAKVFNYMQESNTNINILKSFFTKYNEEINTAHGRKWLMNNIGKYNNIELLKHVEQYYDVDDNDIYFILNGTIDERNNYYINTIKYIFENYDFYYDIFLMFDIIRELYYLENDDGLMYIITKLVQNDDIKFIDDFLNNHQMDNYLRSNLIDCFVKVLNVNFIPQVQNNIINLVNINHY